MLTLILLQVLTRPDTQPVIRPAPDPWPTHDYACRLVQSDAKRIAARKPDTGESVSTVEQRVDCETRTVTRVFAVKSKKVKLAQSAQRTADKFACANPANQIMYERDGWSFQAEFRGPNQPFATASATAKCEPLNMWGYQSPK
jgi:hypothetical protein